MSGVGDEWGGHNGLTKSLEFSHHLARVFPPELYTAHPEFFPLVDGGRMHPPGGSVSWNPDLGRVDVAKYAAEAAMREFDARPERESFSLSVNDGLTFGESPETLALVTPAKWFRGRPDYSALVFTFMNRAATELTRTHPEKYLGALAYYWAENTPGFRIHPQVVPFLTADRAQGYDLDFKREEFGLQDRWAQAGAKRLGMYDYLFGFGYLIPRIHTHLLAENIRHARRAGFTDYFAEVAPNWGLDGPMPWLAARLLEDPEQPLDRLLEEYYRRYFQVAAGPMRQFFEVCEQRWMAQPGPAYWLKHYRNESQAVLFPEDSCRQLRVLLDRAEALASTETVRQRVKLVSRAFGVTERLVALKEARDRVMRSTLAHEVGWRAALPALRVYLTARKEFIRYTVNLKHAEPLAVSPFDWDDYLRNDPVADVLLAAQEAAKAGGEVAAFDRFVEPMTEPMITRLWSVLREARSRPTQELLRNGALEGLARPPRRIAGLEYSLALPEGWVSRVEPTQDQHAELLESGGKRMLRISGSKNTSISQWDPVAGAGLHRASISVRGRVSPGTIVSITFAWLDERERRIGIKILRLPDGEWPGWATLEQAGTPPTGAVWVGMGMQVQNQVPGDWIEARDFHLQAHR